MIAPDLQPLARPIADLHSLPGNPRRGNVEAVMESYRTFGQRKPVVALRDGTVIAGNHQLEAARRLGWTEIAVVYVEDDDTTAKAYALADNRTAELGTYDNFDLAQMLKAVSVDEALFDATGYTDKDLKDLLKAIEPLPTITDADDVPEQAPAKTVPGDVWVLGPHRLVCGDSTDSTVSARLMGDTKADLVWTDPPYGVAYVGKTADAMTIENDDMNVKELEQFLFNALGNTHVHTRPGAVWYVAAPSGVPSLAFSTVLHALKVWRHTLVWVKDTFVMGRADYHYRHEIMYYGWTEGAAHQTPPDRKQDTVWEITRPKANREHPTMKPIDLIVKSLENSTNKGDIVIDPFGGSGSTLIACHQTGRIARLIELDPTYCDVICARFQKATGILPIAEATGQEHDFTLDK
jgi:DNA modification methylase